MSRDWGYFLENGENAKVCDSSIPWKLSLLIKMSERRERGGNNQEHFIFLWNNYFEDKLARNAMITNNNIVSTYFHISDRGRSGRGRRNEK